MSSLARRTGKTPPPQRSLNALFDAYRAGEMHQVIKEGEKLLQRHAGVETVYVLLGAAFLTVGEPAQAEKTFRRAVAVGIREAGIFGNLGMAVAGQGRHAEAAEFYRQAIALDPERASAHNNLGNALKACGQRVEALDAYCQAIAREPNYPDAYNNMGLILEALGRGDDALAAYVQALTLAPDHAEALNNLGNVQAGLGDLAGAAACYERALANRPAYAEAWYNLGNIFRRQDRVDEAYLAYERAKAARPGYADAWAEQGKTLGMEGRFDEAIAVLGEALAIDPGHLGALSHRAFYKAHVCDWSAFADWQAIDPAASEQFSPFTALTFEDDPARQLARSRSWVKKNYSRVSAPAVQASLANDGRIHIGYFSADFHDHATLFLMAGLLREHDRSRFAVHAFSYGPARGGAMREHVLAHVDSFHEIGAMADAAVADLARGIGLDIAVDLKGYTQDSRTQLFACRLAPVQISYLGYPGSSGADFIDYLIADAVVVPEAERAFCSEPLLLLPNSYQPNDDARVIAGQAPGRAACGLPEDALVLCCFNQSYKIGPREFAIWMRVLAGAPNSVLWLLRSNRWAEDNLRREAAAHGIAPERLVFAEPVPQAEHLARLCHADLFLDTFNVNAHTTASDALWAGVPVITLAGRQFAARVCASVLNAIGLPDLVTDNAAGYETLIAALASEPERLADIRARLEVNRTRESLFDTVRYTRDLERAFAAVHQRRLHGMAPATLAI